jgi:hypothetical protein
VVLDELSAAFDVFAHEDAEHALGFAEDDNWRRAGAKDPSRLAAMERLSDKDPAAVRTGSRQSGPNQPARDRDIPRGLPSNLCAEAHPAQPTNFWKDLLNKGERELSLWYIIPARHSRRYRTPTSLELPATMTRIPGTFVEMH